MLYPIDDHVARALDRLAEQYRASTKLIGMLSALVQQIQEIDDAEWELATERYLYSDVEIGVVTPFFEAEGVQLDMIGVILQETRGSLTDVEYRLVLRAKVKLMRSSGTIEELIAIFHALDAAGSVVITPYYPACFTLTISHVLNAAEAAVHVRFIRQGRAAGVGGCLLWQESTDAHCLILSDAAAYPEVDTNTGLGDLADPDAGGFFTGASY